MRCRKVEFPPFRQTKNHSLIISSSSIHWTYFTRKYSRRAGLTPEGNEENYGWLLSLSTANICRINEFAVYNLFSTLAKLVPFHPSWGASEWQAISWILAAQVSGWRAHESLFVWTWNNALTLWITVCSRKQLELACDIFTIHSWTSRNFSHVASVFYLFFEFKLYTRTLESIKMGLYLSLLFQTDWQNAIR